MMQLGLNVPMTPGKTVTGQAIQEIPGGYVVTYGNSQRGVVETADKIALRRDILLKVVGYRGGQPLFHAVFSGYR